jgi:RHS repeat-associated protein
MSKQQLQTVIYQQGKPDAFYHYYFYDATQRLTSVSTSTDGIGKENQVGYEYYLMGKLKRQVLADGLQGIDYTYTLDGRLKAINHPHPAYDPGKDGILPNTLPDVFSEQLQYYPGDYARTGNHLEQNLISNTDFPVSYTGRLQGQVFRNVPSALASNVGNGVWGYVYDAKQQLSQSRYAGMQYWDLYERGVVPAFSDALSEKNLQYDNNGNLRSLQRYDKNAVKTDDFVYNYKVSGSLPTNQLESIGGYASYVYNALGQLIEEKDKDGITKYKVEYNVQGLVVAVRDKNDVVRVSFAYNESGQRIRKTGGGKTTFYVRDNSGNVLSIYEQQTASSDFEQVEVPLYGSGRIGQFRPKDQSYVYELRDHLGSVRAVILRRTKVGGGVDVLSYSDYYVLGGSVNGGGVPYRHGYQGQFAEKDPETGWDSFELRMYDSKIGRWMSVDPAGQYPSPYVGMGNDWGNRTDPTGGVDGIYQDSNGKEIHRTNEGGSNYDIFYLDSYKVEGGGWASRGGSVLFEKGGNYGSGTISAYEPGFFGNWQNSGNLFAQAGYGIVNGLWTGAQALAGQRDNTRNLGGGTLNEAEAARAGVGLLASFIPIGKALQGAKGVNVAAGGVKFTQAEAAAANRLGFFGEEVAINNGVADVPIMYMSVVKPTDITTVFNVLRSHGALSIRVNSGPIINSTISSRLESAFNLGKDFLGFKIIKTGDPNNAFILTRGL